MIIQIGILFIFLAVGEFIVRLTDIPVPSSIIGMLLLASALKVGVVRLSWVERAATFLVNNLGFFFVPAGIALMRCMGIVKDQLWPIVGASVLSTVLIIAVTGWVHQWVRKGVSRRGSREGTKVVD